MARQLLCLVLFSTAISLLIGESTASSDCYLPPQRGPCFSKLVSYYYETSSDECRVFVYSGCGGNNNRFRTIKDCLRTCSYRYEVDSYYTIARPSSVVTRSTRPPVTRGRRVGALDPVCFLTPDSGCTYGGQNLMRYYYSAEHGQCLRLLYCGVGGNGNRFDTPQACERKCVDQPTPPPLFTYPTPTPLPFLLTQMPFTFNFSNFLWPAVTSPAPTITTTTRSASTQEFATYRRSDYSCSGGSIGRFFARNLTACASLCELFQSPPNRCVAVAFEQPSCILYSHCSMSFYPSFGRLPGFPRQPNAWHRIDPNNRQQSGRLQYFAGLPVRLV